MRGKLVTISLTTLDLVVKSGSCVDQQTSTGIRNRWRKPFPDLIITNSAEAVLISGEIDTIDSMW